MSVPVTMTLAGRQLKVSVAASEQGRCAEHGEVWICSVSRAVPISIGRGENRGREVTYYNVVRNLLKVGDWNGNAGSWTVPLENISREASMPRWSMSRTAIATSPARCWARRIRRCTNFRSVIPGSAVRRKTVIEKLADWNPRLAPCAAE